MAHVQQVVRDLPFGTVKVNAVFGGAPGGAAHPGRGSGQGSVTDPSSWTR
jgi:succinate-semialdehyde dehydrogenase/glutarate-semialdehyde dehydrogenase